MVRFLLAILMTAAVAVGCTKASDPSSPNLPPQEKPLLIGLVPEQNIFHQLERYEPLAEYLGRKIGVRIELQVLPFYGNLIDNFESLGLDGAFFGSFSYALAHAKLDLEVLARPEDSTGESTYHGVILVRRDSGIRTVRDMKGKRLAFVARATAAGYLFPLIYLHGNGVSRPETYFREVYFTGTHEDMVWDVLNGKTDVGSCKNTTLDRLASADPRVAREILVLDRSSPFPENGLAMKKGIEASLKEKIKTTLISMDKDPEGQKVLERFGVRRFIETTDGDYETVLKYARRINLDLSTYKYSNK